MTWTWDLATILVLLTIISGLIWIFDILWLAPRRALAKKSLSAHTSESSRQSVERPSMIVDLSRSLFPVFLIVLFLRSFLVEPFRIPSGSMMPTLLIGDFILVNKFSYGIRLPVLNYKIINIGEPQRGDVVVFRYPEDPSIPFIKRVVGLPGDHIVYHDANKTFYVNGEPIAQQVIGVYQGIGAGSNMTGAEDRIENLPQVPHHILVFPRQIPSPGRYTEMVIPEGQYFVLGDNRDNSKDSRYWGTVPENNLIGKAFFIWMNWDLQNGGVNWHRLGTLIH